MIHPLEQRRVLSFTVYDNTLIVNGTTGAETVSAAWRVFSNGDMTVRVFDGTSSQDHNHRVSNPAGNYFNRVSLYGGNGNDILRGATTISGWSNSTAALLPVIENGGAASDTVYGTSGHDVLYGGSGNDRLESFAGHDTLNGDGGADVVIGGVDNDLLIAHSDALVVDTLTGGAGFDVFSSDPVLQPDGTYQPLDLITDLQGELEGDFITYIFE